MKPDAELRMKVYQEGQRAYNAGLTCPYLDWRKDTWTKGWQAAKDYNEQLDQLEQGLPPKRPQPQPSAWLYKELRSTGSYSPPYLADCLSFTKPDERFIKSLKPLYTLESLGLKE